MAASNRLNFWPEGSRLQLNLNLLCTDLLKLAFFDAAAARDKTSFRAGATLCSEAAAAVTMGSNLDSMQYW